MLQRGHVECWQYLGGHEERLVVRIRIPIRGAAVTDCVYLGAPMQQSQLFVFFVFAEQLHRRVLDDAAFHGNAAESSLKQAQAWRNPIAFLLLGGVYESYGDEMSSLK